MNTQQVAQKLVDLCSGGKFMEAIETLYAKHIVSVEPMAGHGMPAEMQGYEAVRGKSVWWQENHEVHSAKVTGPFVHGDRFIVEFEIDVTEKKTGKRMHLKEAGLYWAHDGKVTREEFFMLPQGM